MGINPEDLPVDYRTLEFESASGPYNDNCVTVARAAGHVLLGDSERPDVAPLVFRDDEFAAFVVYVKKLSL